MIAALDVHYTNATAHAAAVVFADWRSSEYVASYSATESPVADYEPGKFYLRELSPLLKVIAQINESVDTYVIDGYCQLSANGAAGLGAYLHDRLSPPANIVGVAKNRYRDSEHAVEVLRASSLRPLFVTAIGISDDTAAQYIASMAGRFRIPDMLKAVDRMARTKA